MNSRYKTLPPRDEPDDPRASLRQRLAEDAAAVDEALAVLESAVVAAARRDLNGLALRVGRVSARAQARLGAAEREALRAALKGKP